MTSVSTDRRQGVNAGAAFKVPVKAATTANITLSGEQTVDGIALVTGDRCLVKNQTSGVNNGIYTVDTGSWTRSPDWDGTYDVKKGTLVYVTGGTVNAGLIYAVTTSDPITIGTTSVAFGAIVNSNTLTIPVPLTQGGTAATSAISALSNLGVIQVTAEGGTANAQTGTIDALVTALRADQLFIFVPSVANTGATTLTLTPSGSGALAAKNIFANGAALAGNELVASMPVLLQYDGTQFNIIGPNLQQNGSPTWIAAGGTADAITATYSPPVKVLVDGMLLGFRATAANATTTPTFAPNGLTARTIVKRGGGALVAGDIPGNLSECVVRYNLANTRWELINPAMPFTPITNSLSGDVALNNTANFFDGPSVAQGTAGTWFVSGTISVNDTAGGAVFHAKLWDGTTVISAGVTNTSTANQIGSIALSGIITSPAGNLRISAKDSTSTSGNIKFNITGTSKDSTITAVRIG